MQLGWPWSAKQRSPSLELAPLKKIVAVSDEYWGALYSPIIDVVSASLNVFDKQKLKLYSDYVDQFVKLVRRSKGVVQDDPLLVHLHTYSLVLSFSALYIARICNDFDFLAISKSKKNVGERTVFYPWLSVPENSELKLSKVSRSYPVYIQAVSIFNALLTDIGWKWLHTKPEVLKSLLDSIYSNGEKGSFSGILSDMRAAPLGSSSESIKTVVELSPDETNTEALSNPADLDSLIDGLGGNNEDISLDELLEPSKNSQTEVINEPKSSDNSNNELDLSIFESESSKNLPNNNTSSVQKSDEPADVKPEVVDKISSKENESSVTSENALNEFTAFLASATDDESKPKETGESENEIKNDKEHEMLFSSEATITTDLINWCLLQVQSTPSSNGVHIILFEGNKVIALEQDKGVMEFVRSDYDLDSEAAYISVAEEVLTDIGMSRTWIENNDGGDIWKLNILGEDVNIIIFNVPVPSDFKLLDKKSYSFPSV